MSCHLYLCISNTLPHVNSFIVVTLKFHIFSVAPINQTTANTVDGINLEEIKEFAKAFKIRRLSLGLTQTQVGQALSITEGPAYSQSAICRYVFLSYKQPNI